MNRPKAWLRPVPSSWSWPQKAGWTAMTLGVAAFALLQPILALRYHSIHPVPWRIAVFGVGTLLGYVAVRLFFAMAHKYPRFPLLPVSVGIVVAFIASRRIVGSELIVFGEGLGFALAWLPHCGMLMNRGPAGRH